jgi:hypothetical protein
MGSLTGYSLTSGASGHTSVTPAAESVNFFKEGRLNHSILNCVYRLEVRKDYPEVSCLIWKLLPVGRRHAPNLPRVSIIAVRVVGLERRESPVRSSQGTDPVFSRAPSFFYDLR